VASYREVDEVEGKNGSDKGGHVMLPIVNDERKRVKRT